MGSKAPFEVYRFLDKMGGKFAVRRVRRKGRTHTQKGAFGVAKKQKEREQNDLVQRTHGPTG